MEGGRKKSRIEREGKGKIKKKKQLFFPFNLQFVNGKESPVKIGCLETQHSVFLFFLL